MENAQIRKPFRARMKYAWNAVKKPFATIARATILISTLAILSGGCGRAVIPNNGSSDAQVSDAGTSDGQLSRDSMTECSGNISGKISISGSLGIKGGPFDIKAHTYRRVNTVTNFEDLSVEPIARSYEISPWVAVGIQPKKSPPYEGTYNNVQHTGKGFAWGIVIPGQNENVDYPAYPQFNFTNESTEPLSFILKEYPQVGGCARGTFWGRAVVLSMPRVPRETWLEIEGSFAVKRDPDLIK